MRIAFLVNDFYLGGGGERVVVGLAEDFIKKEYSVTIISLCSRRGRQSPFSINEKVELKHLNTDKSKSSYLNKVISYFVLKKYLKEEKFDFVLGIGTYLNVLLAITRSNTKLIGCEHNYFFSVSWSWDILRRICYKKLSAVVALTSDDIEHFRILNSKSVVIPNSLPFVVEEQSAKVYNKKIVALGRLSEQKGYDLMLDMFADFCQINKDWNLEIRGSGSEEKKIRELVKDLDLTNRVSILPTTKDVISVYMDASIYLMTSRYEGLPMVLLEASEIGLPMVAYNCKTGPSEVIKDGENGFLIPCFDKKEMIEKLQLLCSDFNLRKKMGKRAKEEARKFSRDKVVSQWEKLFKELN